MYLVKCPLRSNKYGFSLSAILIVTIPDLYLHSSVQWNCSQSPDSTFSISNTSCMMCRVIIRKFLRMSSASTSSNFAKSLALKENVYSSLSSFLHCVIISLNSFISFNVKLLALRKIKSLLITTLLFVSYDTSLRFHSFSSVSKYSIPILPPKYFVHEDFSTLLLLCLHAHIFVDIQRYFCRHMGVKM